MNDLALAVTELQRRLANVVRRGSVHSVDYSQNPPRCRVQLEPKLITGWLLWSSGRAGSRNDFEPLTVGEAVIVLAPCGELTSGIVLPALANEANPVAADENSHSTIYEDGTTVKYDRANKKLTVTIAGGDAEITCNTLTINGDIVHVGNQSTTGDIAATGDVADGVRSMAGDRTIYNGHTHNTAVGPPSESPQ